MNKIKYTLLALSLCFSSLLCAQSVTEKQADLLMSADKTTQSFSSQKNRFQCIYIASKSEIQSAPAVEYIVNKEFATVGDIIVVTGLDKAGLEQGDTYVLFRQGDARLDPQTRKINGYEAIAVGEAQIFETDPEVKLKVTEQVGTIQVGSRLMTKVMDEN